MGHGQGNLVVRTQRNWRVSVTSHLGPRNAWPWNPAGLTRQRDGDTLVGYVVVRTSADLRGHCGRSRSWNTAVSLDGGISTGLKQPARSALEAFLHYKLVMNPNLPCLSLGVSRQNGPHIKAFSKWSPAMTAGWSSHQQIIVFSLLSQYFWQQGGSNYKICPKSATDFKIETCHAWIFPLCVCVCVYNKLTTINSCWSALTRRKTLLSLLKKCKGFLWNAMLQACQSRSIEPPTL